jgi:hypothetical protein
VLELKTKVARTSNIQVANASSLELKIKVVRESGIQVAEGVSLS